MILSHLALLGFLSGLGASRNQILVPTKKFTLIVPGSCNGRIRNLPLLTAGIPQTVTYDFGLFLPPGTTLTGTPTVTLSVVPNHGTDNSPSSRLTGGPQVGTAPILEGGTGFSNTSILQQLTLLGGVTYLLWMRCARSDGTDIGSFYTHVTGQTPA